MKKTIISIVRGKLRKVVYKYLFLRWLIIYGAHLHPTVRLSRTTTIDKVNPKGVFIDEYTYLAGGRLFLHTICAGKCMEKLILVRSVLLDITQ